MQVLAFDSATSACSCALWRDGDIVAHRFETMVRGHGERLMGMVRAVMADADADFADMARLLAAEQIAGAADVHIVARQAETGAKTVEAVYHFEALARRRRDAVRRRQGEIGVATQFRAPDTAAQLIELRQAKHIGAVHDHGVDARQIEA